MKRTSRVIPILFFLLASCQNSQTVRVPEGQMVHDPELARAENDKAFELIQQGKYAEAEPHVVRSLAADVMFGPAHNNRGLIYYYTGRLYLAAWVFENEPRFVPY